MLKRPFNAKFGADRCTLAEIRKYSIFHAAAIMHYIFNMIYGGNVIQVKLPRVNSKCETYNLGVVCG